MAQALPTQGQPEAQKGKALARGRTAGPGLRVRILDSLSRALSAPLTNRQETCILFASRSRPGLWPVGRMKRTSSAGEGRLGREQVWLVVRLGPMVGPLKVIIHILAVCEHMQRTVRHEGYLAPL